MRISDWSSDVCSSDLRLSLQAASDRMQDSLIGGAYSAIAREAGDGAAALFLPDGRLLAQARSLPLLLGSLIPAVAAVLQRFPVDAMCEGDGYLLNDPFAGGRSDEHTSELQSLMRIAYARFCVNTK